MRELVEDETKYKRELKTLVDGVIPVLLTCVLSKSDSALAAGLFNPHRDPSQDSAITKPIVDMGVALERLKSLHNRIPLADADAFISWAQSAHRTYEDYLSAWRAGFQDVVVNLEPATSDKQLAIDEIERDENGDAVGANGERADVAYFLKRPLVRVKFLARTTKGLSNLMKTAKSQKVEEQYQELAQTARRRHKEESARLEDEKANNTDPTRARDPRTLDLVDGVKIDRTRQVCAKDIFHLDLEHSTGQRVGCRVELVLRDKPDDEGDVLICEMDELRRFLLFPPIAKSSISARLGDGKDQVIIMIRGVVDNKEWHELLLLEADDPEAAEEWVELLGSVPLPPPIETIIDSGQQLDALVSSVGIWQDRRQHLMSGGLGLKDIQIPIGERLRRGEEEIAEPSTPDRKRVSQRRAPASFGSLPTSITEESLLSEPVVDLNDAMNKAGSLSTPKRPRAARYHDRSSPIRPSTPKDSADLSSEHSTPTQSREDMKSLEASQRDQDRFGPREVNVPKIRASSTPASPETAKSSTPLKEYMRPQSSPTTPTQQDSPPPPPPHRSPTPKALKKAPVLDTKAARNLNRRTSSPLKHEYQPSDASGTSSAEDSDSETDSTGSYSESSDDEELESVQEAGPVPIYGKRVSPSGSIYSLPNTTLAPSNSASQGPYRKAPVQCDAKDTERHTVMSLSYWNEKGQWVDIYSGPCSLIIGPGWLRAYKMDDYHSNPYQDRPYSSSGSADVDHRSDAATPLPLIAQELTPNVFMQRHTIDIHVRSPPMAESTLKCKGTTVRYHMLTPVACVQLYQSLYESSKNNMTYNKLEEERRINAYGTYGAAVPNNRRNSWFGRRNSYRASARAPSEMVSEQSGRSSQSRMSALRLRLSGGSIFNIAKSSIDVSQGGNRSGTNSLGSSEYSGITPPRTPTSMFSGSGGANIADLGSENIRVRLYQLATTSKWEDKRYAYLTVTPPPPGRRPNSTLRHGIEKHIIVTRREHNHRDGPGEVIIDEVLGANCFQMVGVKGVMVTIWDDIRGPNGEIGQIGASGGVAGRQRKFLFQTSWVAHANWIFGICSAGR
ncbi:hypothetical protein M7I_7616 [Glarea lozoyensis 74030]|nr:hypothetical protein M7I_7616 [Glarea lozoyensis 74030]